MVLALDIINRPAHSGNHFQADEDVRKNLKENILNGWVFSTHFLFYLFDKTFVYYMIQSFSIL